MYSNTSTKQSAENSDHRRPIYSGLVVGPGSGTSDSVPALIQPGAFVINSDTVEFIGAPLLDILNRAGDQLLDVNLSAGEFVLKQGAVAALGVEFCRMLNDLGLLKRFNCLDDKAVFDSLQEILSVAASVVDGKYETRRRVQRGSETADAQEDKECAE